MVVIVVVVVVDPAESSPVRRLLDDEVESGGLATRNKAADGVWWVVAVSPIAEDAFMLFFVAIVADIFLWLLVPHRLVLA